MNPTLLTIAMYQIGQVSFLQRPATYYCGNTYLRSGGTLNASAALAAGAMGTTR